MVKDSFDVVVVGAGPAGLAAGIQAKKYGLNYLVLDKGGITNSILHFPVQMIFFTTPELIREAKRRGPGPLLRTCRGF